MLSLLCLETSELRLPGWSLSPVTSAGKAVDCAVISARVNVTTRPTAQTTTSSSAWPRVSFASCSSSLRFLQPHWIPCPGQSRVPVRKRARKMACVRNKNETETPPKHRHGGRKKKAPVPISHFLHRLPPVWGRRRNMPDTFRLATERKSDWFPH